MGDCRDKQYQISIDIVELKDTFANISECKKKVNHVNNKAVFTDIKSDKLLWKNCCFAPFIEMCT